MTDALVLGAAQDLVSAVIRPKRKIGAIQAQVTVSERHDDRVTISRHPIEQGAAITDHAYKEPSRLTLLVGWSNSSSAGLLGALGRILSGGGESYVQHAYKELLALQANRELFAVVTGKRKYDNMLIEGLATTTDERTEEVLFITVTCQQVIVVETQTAPALPAKTQAAPERTASPASTGTKQVAPAPGANKSALAKIFGN